MKMMINVVLLSILILPVFAQAKDINLDYLMVGGWSQHISNGDTTNSEHNVLGAEIDEIEFGYFKNSYDDDTYYIGKSFRWEWERHVDIIGSIGASYGYRGCWSGNGDRKVCPHGYLGFSYTKYRFQPTLKFYGNAVVFSPEIKF